MSSDIYESAVRPQGRFGVVFERDDATAYFYLLDLQKNGPSQIVGAHSLPLICDMPRDVPVRVTWAPEGDIAGLLVEGRLVAVFDVTAAMVPMHVARSAQPGERGRFLDS